MPYKLCIAAISSGSGKTTITLGLLAALKKRGLKVQPFKCGPDYIDPGYHKEASGTISRNLDSWMMGSIAVEESFNSAMKNKDIAVIEGVMGLYDGASSTDIVGSSAHIAKLTSTPILLVINARGIARTIAPIVKGFINFEEGVKIEGVIANNVGSERHADILRESLDHANLPPLVGFLKRNDKWKIPERHLGLVPGAENGIPQQWYSDLANEIEQNFDIDRILDICSYKISNNEYEIPNAKIEDTPCDSNLKIGIALDKAFHFYYEDNLDALRDIGIELIPFSPLKDSQLPSNISGVIIGGGFPEMFAEELSRNTSMRESISKFAKRGGTIYAECGGLMYLSQAITDTKSNKFKMCAVLPFETTMNSKLRRLGYREVITSHDSILGPAGTKYRGHEFHWSSIVSNNEENNIKNAPYSYCCKTRGARGTKQWKETGCQVNNVYASYIHAHFSSNKEIVNNISSFLKSNI